MRGGYLYRMLKGQKKHLSFHTPGHKKSGFDITELSYSDNLLSPGGVILKTEEELAKILGAERTFLLTDGTTCGVYAMLYALRQAGLKRVAYPAFSHKSVKDGCRILSLEGVEFGTRTLASLQPSLGECAEALKQADALLVASPDYYGNFPPLEQLKSLCNEQKKPLLIDGAHGAHLHFCKEYAGNYADMWADGAHKSLPALTQGAAVSAKNAFWARKLQEGVTAFRTTSPSYPIMASVEQAFLYPRNEKIERLAQNAKSRMMAYPNADWSKILIPFGNECDLAQAELEKKGIYCEFNDGNFLMFYLSPCTKARDLKRLERQVSRLPRGDVREEKTQTERIQGENARWVPVANAKGRVCAGDCGLFPPCVPLVLKGERITEEVAQRLLAADNTFGLRGDEILVYEEK